jgi:hypothetical protein
MERRGREADLGEKFRKLQLGAELASSAAEVGTTKIKDGPDEFGGLCATEGKADANNPNNIELLGDRTQAQDGKAREDAAEQGEHEDGGRYEMDVEPQHMAPAHYEPLSKKLEDTLRPDPTNLSPRASSTSKRKSTLAGGSGGKPLEKTHYQPEQVLAAEMDRWLDLVNLLWGSRRVLPASQSPSTAQPCPIMTPSLDRRIRHPWLTIT